MEVRFKNFVTIRGSYTQQGLSNHITFRPIKSGATVPLKLVGNEKVGGSGRWQMVGICLQQW
jgi:hypothetical protein